MGELLYTIGGWWFWLTVVWLIFKQTQGRGEV